MVFGHLFVVLDDLASSLPSYPQEVLLVKGLLRFEIEYTRDVLTYINKGGTGFGVRTMLNWLKNI
jgi:hypothetical protein